MYAFFCPIGVRIREVPLYSNETDITLTLLPRVLEAEMRREMEYDEEKTVCRTLISHLEKMVEHTTTNGGPGLDPQRSFSSPPTYHTASGTLYTLYTCRTSTLHTTGLLSYRHAFILMYIKDVKRAR